MDQLQFAIKLQKQDEIKTKLEQERIAKCIKNIKSFLGTSYNYRSRNKLEEIDGSKLPVV